MVQVFSDNLEDTVPFYTRNNFFLKGKFLKAVKIIEREFQKERSNNE